MWTRKESSQNADNIGYDESNGFINASKRLAFCDILSCEMKKWQQQKSRKIKEKLKIHWKIVFFFFRFICSEHVGPISFICDDERASGRKKKSRKTKTKRRTNEESWLSFEAQDERQQLKRLCPDKRIFHTKNVQNVELLRFVFFFLSFYFFFTSFFLISCQLCICCLQRQIIQQQRSCCENKWEFPEQ